MRPWVIACALLVAATTVPSAAQIVTKSSAWSFEKFPAVADFAGTPAEPKLATVHERRYRTEIREQAQKGPNFAGHFTLAQWGCGSPCVGFVIIDARSGAIFDPELSVGCASKNGMGAGLDFRLKSRLLAVDGMSSPSSDDACGTNYYDWNGQRLKLLHFEPWQDSGP